MANPTVTIPAPVRQARRGGIYSVVTPTSEQRLFAAHSVEWEANECGVVVATAAGCYSDEEQDDKLMVGSEGWETGPIPIFGGYFGVECFAGANQDFEQRALQGLENGEARLIEGRLAMWFASGGSVNAADAETAIATADRVADNDYAGLPIIHVNRGDAVKLAKAGLFGPNGTDDGRLWTANGTPVVASAKYAQGQVSVTGAIGIVRSDVKVTRNVHAIYNQEMAIAERAYGISTDCNFVYTFDYTP